MACRTLNAPLISKRAGSDDDQGKRAGRVAYEKKVRAEIADKRNYFLRFEATL